MQSKIAIDVVLLPPREVMRQCIDLIEYDNDSVIKLNMDNCLPHISLAMGVVQKSDLPKIESILRLTLDGFKTLPLQLEKTSKHTITNGKSIAFIDIAPNEEVAKLFVKIKESLEPYVDYEVEASMFFAPPPIDPISMTWVEHYYDNNKVEDFHGHITLGEGKVKPINHPIHFQVPQLAICHLGNYCTCRRVLGTIKLA